jgi:hypothetical protein
MFKDIPEVIFILKTTYSNIILKATVGQEILKFYQKKHPLKDFLPK